MQRTFVLFDVDGTLVYSNKIDSWCFAATYEKIYQKPFPSIDWRRYPHVTDHTIFGTVIQQQFERAVNPTEIDFFQEAYLQLLQAKRKTNPEDFKAVPGAKAMIDRLLEEKHFEVGIATGGWERPARLKLKHIGIPAERLIVSAADNQVSREDILQQAIDEAQAKNEIQRTVYLGDAVWDVTTTRNMGLDFVGVRLKGDFHELTTLGASGVLQDFRDYDLLLQTIATAVPPQAPEKI